MLRNVFDVPIFKGFAFEGIANRDSLKYIDLYNLPKPEEMDSMFRGTLRYKGFCELMSAFNQLGLLETSEGKVSSSGSTWNVLLKDIVGAKSADVKALRQAIVTKLSISDQGVERVLSAIDWLGMFCANQTIDTGSKTPLDVFCALLQQKLRYEPGERDMVAMHHVFGITHSNGSKETKTSTLIAYGDPKSYSAMAKTVGLPAAIATEMVLNGGVKRNGVVSPMTPDIYEPMLHGLKKVGINFVESSKHHFQK